MQQRRGFAAALLHSLFSLGKLYLYLPQGTVTTMVGTSTQVFAGNAVTGNAPMAFDFLIADEHDRVNAAIDVLLWNTIKGGNSGENDVKTTLNLPKTGAYGTTITRSASPSGIINTDTGTVTRQFADKTVVLTATVSYMGLAAKTKTFNLTVPAIPGRLEAEEAVINNAKVYGNTEGEGASGGKQVGSINKKGSSYVRWNNLPVSPMVEIRYASENSGTISIYKNEVPVMDAAFTSTGGWYGEGCFDSLWIPLELSSGDSLKIQYDDGDAVLNLDYIECYSDVIAGAVINPVSAAFDKTHPADVNTIVEWNDAGLITGIKTAGAAIGASNYSVSGSTLTRKKEYLAAKADGELALTIEFDRGAPATITITVTDTTQEAVELPFIITSVSSSVSDGVLNITANIVNSGSTDTEAVAIIAVFDSSDRMVGIKTFPALYRRDAPTPVSYPYPCGGRTGLYFKVFVFDKTNNIRPLSEVFISK